ncbi:MAG: phospho-sugar mutase [Firmicutes bacterium]|nr:phospho-sugar mutase [Bacillota bacterium]
MELKFGTAGIRGIMGPEPGLMNNETVRLATLGVAGWLKTNHGDGGVSGDKDLLVVISRDSRNNSLEFALETARTLEECGIRALMFEEIMPVPVLSFAVRYLKADAGVMITASHNAKEYNGYKLYGATGGQVLPEDADVVQAEIGKVSEEAKTTQSTCPHVSYVPEEVYQAYLEAMREASNATQPIDGDPLKVIYTPLNGSGFKPVTETLAADGYDLFTVPEQEQPDGNFTTTGQPNPEFPAVYRLALEYAKEKQPDIIVATDPDCDRVGSMVKTADGYRLLSGNDQGVLVLSYLCETRDMSGKTFISSFVSTPLADRIAKAKGMNVEKTPVGFKFIAAGMDRTQEQFGYAFEESNGMIIGQYARDKDGVVGARLLCQAADYYRKKGSSAAEELDRLNAEYGPVYSKTIDVVVDPSLPKPETTVTEFDDGSKVVVRPSGTEPKVKYYFFAPSRSRIEDLRNTYGV